MNRLGQVKKTPLNPDIRNDVTSSVNSSNLEVRVQHTNSAGPDVVDDDREEPGKVTRNEHDLHNQSLHVTIANKVTIISGVPPICFLGFVGQ